MATKQIALSIKIDGVEVSIEQLKKLSAEAQKTESSVGNIGSKTSEGLKEVGNAADTAATKTKKLTDTTKEVNKSISDQIQTFGKFALGVTGAFAAAAQAATLFGADSEQANKIAEKAQKAFNIVLGVSAALEGVYALKKLFTTKVTQKDTAAKVQATVATELETTATGGLAAANVVATTTTVGLTGAINALGTAIKKNPILFILGILTSITVAIVALTDDTKDYTKEIEKLDEALRKLNAEQDNFINNLNNESKILEAQAKTIEEVSEIRINLTNKEIESNNKKIAKLKENQKIELGFIKEKNLSEEEALSQRIQVNQKYESQILNLQKDNENKKTQITLQGINDRKEIEARDAELKQKNRELETSLIQNDLQEQLQNLEDTYLKRRKEEVKLIEQKKADNTTLTLLDKNYYQDRNEIIEQAQKQLEQLELQFREANNRSTLDDYAKQLFDLKKSQSEELQTTLEGFDKINDGIKNKTKERTITITNALNEIKTITVSLTEEQYALYQDAIKRGENETKELIKNLTVDALKSRSDIQNQYFTNLIKSYRENGGATIEQIKLSGLALQEAQLQQYQEEFELFAKKELDKSKFLATAEGERQGLSGAALQSFIDGQIAETQRYLDSVKASYEAEIKLNNEKIIQQEQLNQLNEQSNIEKSQLDKNYFEGLNELLTNVIKSDEKNFKKQQKLYEKYLDEKYLADLAYQKQVEVLNIKRAESELLYLDPAKDAERIAQLEAGIQQSQTRITEITMEETRKRASMQAAEQKSTFDKILKGLEIFQTILAQAQSFAQQKFALEMEAMEMQYEETLSKISDKTEEGIALREEAERIYLANKKKLEKQASISSLKFTLAQTIASAAQAIVSVLANPLLDPVSKGILIASNAIISAASVKNIAEQISIVNSTMARGGFLRGPSHEQGGIKYQRGGLGNVELEGNEAVINRRSTLAYAPLLSQINQQGGGKPIYINNIMDSRMAEILASLRTEPIRAYVIEQDISRAQAINKRLEDLASF